MVSSALASQRAIPQKVADVYNNAAPKVAKIIADITKSNLGKLAAIQLVSQQAIDALQALLDTANSNADTIISNARLTNDGQGDQDCLEHVKWCISQGMSLQNLCVNLLNRNDRAGFTALRSILPDLAALGKLGYNQRDARGQVMAHRELDMASQLISSFEARLLTLDEQSRIAEQNENDQNITKLRTSIEELKEYFNDLMKDTSVSGLLVHPTSVYAWWQFVQPIEPDQSTRINLTTDFPEYTARPNQRATAALEKAKELIIRDAPYLQLGSGADGKLTLPDERPAQAL